MIKSSLIIPVLIIFSLSLSAQIKKQDTGLKREVTLYNPYKPSLPDSKKRSFLPDMNDTSKVRPSFKYEVKTTAFLPEYTISPIKAATLLPDPLTRLYKSYVNIGLGNYLSPLAEISITNERSKKGLVGFYGRHFSTNGNIELDNFKKAFAGFMDNDASLYGSRFFRKNVLSGSLDFSEKSRYAYGYSPFVTNYSPSKKDIRIPYNDFGVKASFTSITHDSTEFSYDFNLGFNYFKSSKGMYQRKVSFSGIMSKSVDEFYVGSGIKYIHYGFSDFLSTPAEYVASVSPFLKKSSELWSFKLGLEALLEKDNMAFTQLRVYPDINFALNIVPSYVSYFAALSGKLEKNEPSSVILDNPFMIRDGSLYKLPSTSHDLVILTGLKGNTGLGGNYILSASYSLISDMLFFSNIYFPDFVVNPDRGNYFSAITDDVELLNFHGEMGGPINDKLSFTGVANLYKYTLSKFDHPWNKSNWDGKFGLRYNLRDKIIAGIELTAQGKRYQIINGDFVVPVPETVPPAIDPRITISMPAHFNLNLSAEYRYSKILSFWTKLNNISNNQYYEWAYYPTHGFMFMFGFTYSL
jgi:hypothetical protein